ncbi:MAG: A24 family peptidase [Lachnospiraceae bacterium]|nr:A24 family peptidase [Lachnospiraceae bacterium]
MTYILLIAFVILLIIIAIWDIRTMEISNVAVGIVLGIGVLAAFVQRDLLLWERLVGLICVSLPLLLITMAVPNAFGGGDIKLMAAAGFYLGFRLTLLAFFLSILGGGIYGIWLLLTKKKDKKEHFAFGPFLCAGMIVAVFLGEWLIGWYMNQMGF